MSRRKGGGEQGGFQSSKMKMYELIMVGTGEWSDYVHTAPAIQINEVIDPSLKWRTLPRRLLIQQLEYCLCRYRAVFFLSLVCVVVQSFLYIKKI